jgi:hypothetical protein
MPPALKSSQILDLVLIKIQSKSKTDQHISRGWKKQFQAFNLDHDDVRSTAELGYILRNNFSMDLSERQLTALFLHIDKDGGGTLDRCELDTALLQATSSSMASESERHADIQHPQETRLQASNCQDGTTVTQAWLQASRKAGATAPQHPSKNGPQSGKFDHLAADSRGSSYGHTRERLRRTRTQAWAQPAAISSSRGLYPVIETDFQRLVSPAAQAKSSPHGRGSDMEDSGTMWGHLKPRHENTRLMLHAAGGAEGGAHPPARPRPVRPSG